MPTMPTLSLTLNVLVLVPVVFGMARDAEWARRSYGERTAARGILLSIYVAILFASAAMLVRANESAVATLLALQVAYKLTTPFTVGTVRNPVVLSNLAIAAFHLVTLWTRAGEPS
jgi:hypothetical protein